MASVARHVDSHILPHVPNVPMEHAKHPTMPSFHTLRCLAKALQCGVHKTEPNVLSSMALPPWPQPGPVLPA